MDFNILLILIFSITGVAAVVLYLILSKEIKSIFSDDAEEVLPIVMCPHCKAVEKLKPLHLDIQELILSGRADDLIQELKLKKYDNAYIGKCAYCGKTIIVRVERVRNK